MSPLRFRMEAVKLIAFVLIASNLNNCDASKNRPNIVIIVADDLGWNDVGFHGANEISTPNIDALAYNGVILNSHYSEAICTPSRAALLTGKYPIRTGTQHNVILEGAPWGLPLDQKLMPEYLNDLGYVSHAVGKWHLGYFKKEYTPTFRGFRTHYGFWNGYQDYFTHVVQATHGPYEGLDMRRNLSSDWSSVGRYATHLFDEEFQSIIKSHDVSQPLFLYLAHLAVHAGNYETPLQATVSTIDRFKHILPLEKRLYAGMLWELDQSVGRLVKSLKDKGILDDTIIVFLSDNGAATQGLHKNTGSNWPLKGEKATPWEGALRTVSFVWSRSLKQRRKVLNNMMHISDWLPTLYTAAGGEIENLGAIDGLNQWDYLNGSPCQPRREILHNIDSIFGYSAIRIGKYKYVNGSSLLGFLDTWSGEPDGTRTVYNTSLVLDSQVNTLIGDLTEDDILTSRKNATVKCPDTSTVVCRPLREPCLFDLEADPCERRNLYQKRRQFSKEFEKRIAEFRGVASPPLNKPEEPEADPARFNGTWTNWRDYP